MRGKRSIALLLAALLGVALLGGCGGKSAPQPSFAQSDKPFVLADVEAVIGSFTTIGQVMDAVAPTNYAWSFMGEGTMETLLTMQNNRGSVSVLFHNESGTINQLADGSDKTVPDNLRPLPCSIKQVEWLEKGFAAVKPIRDLEVGATKAQVLAGYLHQGEGRTLYDFSALNPAAPAEWITTWAFVGGRIVEAGGFYDYDTIEYGWCSLVNADETRTYYTLLYSVLDDEVISIRLFIETDEDV